MKNNLSRFRRLLGPSWNGSIKDGKFFIKPENYSVELELTDEDFQMLDKDFVEKIIDPAINILEMQLDEKRPYHLTQYEQMLADAGITQTQIDEQKQKTKAGKLGNSNG